MSKRSAVILFLTVLCSLVISGLLFGQTASNSQATSNKLYVKVPEENLRAAPSGTKIGTVLQGAETTVLIDQDKWVKVQVTGWLWKGSLTETAPSSAQGQMRALHIMVKTKAEADQILQLLKSGSDFQELAKSKSISPTAVKGGDLGFFDKSDFDPQIGAAIAALKVGEISAIIESKFGFNIFKRLK